MTTPTKLGKQPVRKAPLRRTAVRRTRRTAPLVARTSAQFYALLSYRLSLAVLATIVILNLH